LDQYERLTLPLTEDQKKLLSTAFTHSARAWFKDDLLPTIDALAWPDMKAKILGRYRQNWDDYYVELLSKLKYDASQDSGSYVDQRVHLLRRAYPSMKESEIIRDVLISVPPALRSQLNLMLDTSKLQSVSDLKTLVPRFDQQISKGVDLEVKPQLDVSVFKSLLQAAVEQVVNKASPKETLAAANTIGNSESPGVNQNHNYHEHYASDSHQGRNDCRSSEPRCCCHCHFQQTDLSHQRSNNYRHAQSTFGRNYRRSDQNRSNQRQVDNSQKTNEASQGHQDPVSRAEVTTGIGTALRSLRKKTGVEQPGHHANTFSCDWMPHGSRQETTD